MGEISPDEFKHFIGEDIRLEPVILSKEASIEEILSYFMGKNTPERQDFIIDNLRIEKDIAEELALERLRKLNEGLNKDKESNDE